MQELSNLYFELMFRRTDRVQGIVNEFGMTPTQIRTLILMDPKKSATMSELAQRALIEPSNLTGIVDKLESRGIIKRSLAPTDRRVKIVRVTRRGSLLRTKLLNKIREPAPWMLALSEHDQRQLLHILRKGLAYEQGVASES